MSLQSILIASCLKDFQCVGSACELSCCIGWRIDVDDSTVKKYKNCRDESWRQNFLRNMNEPTQENSLYTFKLKDDGSCAFLGDDLLCTIQKRFGAKYLSQVCNNYPRIYNKLNERRYEKSYLMSCPEIIKRLLLHQEPLTFSMVNEKINLSNVHVNHNKMEKNNKYNDYFIDLRKFTIELIQNKEYSLKERLLILAYFFDTLRNNQDIKSTKEIITLFEQIIQNKSASDILSQIKTDRDFYYELLRSIVKSIFNSASDDEFRKYCDKIYNSIYLGKQDKTNYFYLYDGYYTVFSHKHPYVLENYLAYSVFFTFFPINYDDIWDSFVELVVRWSFINFCFMGQMSENNIRDINEREFVRCFASFSRAMDSTIPSCLKIATEYLKQEGKNDINSIFKLLKV